MNAAALERNEIHRRCKSQRHVVGISPTTWQDRSVLYSVQQYMSALTELSASTSDSDEKIIIDRFSDEKRLLVDKKLRKELRKYLQRRGVNLQTLDVPADGEEGEGQHDAIEAQCTEEQRLYHRDDDDDAAIPRCYTVPRNSMSITSLLREHYLDRHSDPNLNPNDNVLVINIPLSERTGEFRVHPVSHLNAEPTAQFAETVMEVISLGYMHGQPCTKVLLYPRTGRWHQLRVHCAEVGHPIVGDATYCCSHDDGALLTSVHRMMLHAYQLRYCVYVCM